MQKEQNCKIIIIAELQMKSQFNNITAVQSYMLEEVLYKEAKDLLFLSSDIRIKLDILKKDLGLNIIIHTTSQFIISCVLLQKKQQIRSLQKMEYVLDQLFNTLAELTTTGCQIDKNRFQSFPITKNVQKNIRKILQIYKKILMSEVTQEAQINKYLIQLNQLKKIYSKPLSYDQHKIIIKILQRKNQLFNLVDSQQEHNHLIQTNKFDKNTYQYLKQNNQIKKPKQNQQMQIQYNQKQQQLKLQINQQIINEGHEEHDNKNMIKNNNYLINQSNYKYQNKLKINKKIRINSLIKYKLNKIRDNNNQERIYNKMMIVGLLIQNQHQKVQIQINIFLTMNKQIQIYKYKYKINNKQIFITIKHKYNKLIYFNKIHNIKVIN